MDLCRQIFSLYLTKEKQVPLCISRHKKHLSQIKVKVQFNASAEITPS